MVDPILLVPPAMVFAATCLPTYRWRRAGLAAALVIQLALASLEITGGFTPLGTALSHGYLAVSAALLLGGLLLAIGSAVGGARSGKGSQSLIVANAVVLVLAGLMLIRAAIPLVLSGGILLTFAALAALGGAGALLVLATGARIMRSTIGKLGRLRGAAGKAEPATEGRLRPVFLALHLAGVLLALVAPNLLLMALGIAVALIAGVRWEFLAGQGPRWSMGSVGALVALVAGIGMLVQVAGATPLDLSGMVDGPFSPAFQQVAVLVLALAAWPLIRLWPLHSTRTGPASALAGAALLLLVVDPILPDGRDHWQPLLFLLLALGAWFGALSRNDSLLSASLAAAGLLSGVPEAGWGGIALLTAAIVVQSLARATRTVPIALIAGRSILVLSSVAIVPLLVGALQAEVFSTVLLVVGAVVGLLSAEDRRRVDRGPSLV